MTKSISNSDDSIDSRDVIERIDELRQCIEDDGEDALDDDKEELKLLEALQEECSGHSEWKSGMQLIRDSHFEEYAQTLAEDIFGVKDGWPYDHIDWEAAADALKIDYSTYDFDGETYYARD